MLLIALAMMIAAGAAVASERASVALEPGWTAEDGSRVAGLAIVLAPGWKTYWRAPGDAGIPPLFDWSGSENLDTVEIVWPTPHVFDSFGLRTIGYDGAVTLPLLLTPRDPGSPIDLRLTFDFGVCAEICVPERAALSLAVTDAGGAPFGAIAAALGRGPVSGAEAGLSRAECSVAGSGSERRFEARLVFETSPPSEAMLVVEGPPGVWFGPAETRIENTIFHAEAEARLWDEGLWIGRDALTLSLIGEHGVIEQQGCVGG
jgi:DsbC/DsbD-like thiol-disulfide interchange protein